MREAWTHRSLLPSLGRRFLYKVIQGTKLGRAWLLIRPLMESLAMTLLFGAVLDLKAPGGVPYYLFLLAGLMGWEFFERSMVLGMRSIPMHRKLMRNHRFPLLLVPLAAMAYPLVSVIVYALVFAGAVLCFWATTGHMWLELSWSFLLVAPGAVLLFLFTTGALLWGSVLNAKARDVRYTLRYALPFWLYATPVLYPVGELPGYLDWVAVANPLAAPVALLKEGLLGVGQVSPLAVVCSTVITAAVLISGLWYFNREAARAASGEVAPDDEDESMV